MLRTLFGPCLAFPLLAATALAQCPSWLPAGAPGQNPFGQPVQNPFGQAVPNPFGQPVPAQAMPAGDFVASGR